jgi:hypothetical protein
VRHVHAKSVRWHNVQTVARCHQIAWYSGAANASGASSCSHDGKFCVVLSASSSDATGVTSTLVTSSAFYERVNAMKRVCLLRDFGCRRYDRCRFQWLPVLTGTNVATSGRFSGRLVKQIGRITVIAIVVFPVCVVRVILCDICNRSG